MPRVRVVLVPGSAERRERLAELLLALAREHNADAASSASNGDLSGPSP